MTETFRNRQYFSKELTGHEVSESIVAIGNSLAGTINQGTSVVQKANESNLANNQIDLSTKFLQKNNEINTKWQADPTNPEREVELKQAFDLMAENYQINPLCRSQWNEIKNNVYNRYKQYNAQWAEKQQQENTCLNLKNGYENLINQASMMGMNGADIDEVRMFYSNGIEALHRGSAPVLGEVIVTDVLNKATHDFMASYLSGMIESNPTGAAELINNESVQNDIGDLNTISKLKQSVQAKLLKETEINAVDRVADYINKNHTVFSKAVNGELSTIEAQNFLQDKNVDRNMRKILCGMLGYSINDGLYADLEDRDIRNKDKGNKTNVSSGQTGIYSSFVIRNKEWKFITDKGKSRKPTEQEKQEITAELYLEGSRLLNNIEGKSPEESIKKIAEYQANVAQGSYFGLNKSDYEKLMNTFVLPATSSIQDDVKNYNANIHQWGRIDKFGYQQIDEYFNKMRNDLGDKPSKTDESALNNEKALASIYYWSALNNYCAKNGMTMQQLQSADRHDTAILYRDSANSAIQKAKATSKVPSLWFRASNPQYVTQIRNMLPNKNANNVIANVALESMSNPNMEDKEFVQLINRHIGNEYSKMRLQNKELVFSGNNKYDDLINHYGKLNGVDPLLIKAIIQHESNFNPKAKSQAGAGGLMQLTPNTAKGLGCKDIYNPEENITAGTKYISSLIKKYNGNLPLALAAYNAGPGNVEKYGNKIPPFEETINYVKRTMNTYKKLRGQ